jgi:hypothetical protein
VDAYVSHPLGMILRMTSSNNGTVKAVSPWPGLQIMPFAISLALCRVMQGRDERGEDRATHDPADAIHVLGRPGHLNLGNLRRSERARSRLVQEGRVVRPRHCANWFAPAGYQLK